MIYLIERAKEYGLDKITDYALKTGAVHGITVSVERGAFNPYLWHFFPNLNFDWDGYNCIIPMDFNWEANPSLTKSKLHITIHIRPGSKPIDFSDIDTSNFSVNQEYRPIARLSADPKLMFNPLEGGVSIGDSKTNVSGTLGGILIDANSSQKYGLTCAHVSPLNADITQPSKSDNPTNSQIGKCILSENPVPNTSSVCNVNNPTSIVNEFDVALIELSATNVASTVNSIGAVHGITPSNHLTSNLLVEFTGRTSGYQSLVINSVTVVKEIIDIAGNRCCFKNLVELKYNSVSNLTNSSPVQRGDSGAWVFTEGPNGREWCAMLIGEDGQNGYAILSEEIIKFLDTKGFKLSL